MPSRSRSRGRPAKRARSSSRGSGMYGRALASRSRSVSRARTYKRFRATPDYHEFTRYQSAYFITTTQVSEPLTYTFALTDVLSYAEFTAMFDQYMIKSVEWKIQMVTNPDSAIMINNNPAATNNSNNFYPKLWYVRDYDGGTADSLNAIKERTNAKFFIMRPNKEYTIKLQPKILVQTYKTALTSGYGPKRMFVDCVDDSLPHYGLNVVIDNLGLDPADTYRFRVDVKFHLAFKGVR